MTVRVVIPVLPDSTAEMVAVPTFAPVARPCDPDKLDTVAAGASEDHNTCVVRSVCEPSV